MAKVYTKGGRTSAGVGSNVGVGAKGFEVKKSRRSRMRD